MHEQVARALKHFSAVEEGAKELVLHLPGLVWLEHLDSAVKMARSRL